MKYLVVVRWDDYQHYKNRRAPWIKNHTDQLDRLEHPRFTALTDGAKLTLHHVRLLAGVTGNWTPEVMINSDRLNMQTKPRVDELIAAGFVKWVDGASASPPDDASADASTIASEHGGDALASGGENSASPRARVRVRGRARAQALSLEESESSGETGDKNQKKRTARELVESFVVTEKHRAWAVENAPGVSIDTATEAWRDHFRSNGYKTRAGPICDADGAWRNWMRNELKYSGRSHGTGNRNGNGNGRESVHRSGEASGPGASPEGTRKTRTAAEFGNVEWRPGSSVGTDGKVH